MEEINVAFSSAVFILIFLPLCLLEYFVLDKKYKNVFLCITSCFFYAWCGLKFLVLVLISSTIAFFLGLVIAKADSLKWKRFLLIIAIIYNLGILFFYKYLFDLFPSAYDLLNHMHLGGFDNVSKIALPMGISFYTFSILSYLLDIYWEKCEPQKSLMNIYLYVLFFPKVLQGPIMRWQDFEVQLYDRNTDITQLNNGIERFVKGMVKKVIIADQLSGIVKYSFEGIHGVGTISAWVSLIAYLLQLYYDFSGYSDMAIGLGLMLGFSIPENFDHPYTSKTVGEYWRRWHITLGAWFKDYVYTPVSRKIISLNIINKTTDPMLLCDLIAMLAVWICTGVWHGSGLKFFLWGMWYFAFLAFERLRDSYRKKKRKKNGIKGKMKLNTAQRFGDRALTVIAIIFGQVIFRANSMQTALTYIHKMLFWDNTDGILILHYFDNYLTFVFIVGIIGCMPVYSKIRSMFRKRAWLEVLFQICLMLMAIITFCYSISAGFTAFMYEIY